ncbi:DUF2254 domain-containing protein [Kitasatospora sp. NBC_01560]|uniref:DUF2254 family protein n=1 Tax=Kitasatospora sp. NBC_01560 TaxID=2975965 RepID=UPI0038683121
MAARAALRRRRRARADAGQLLAALAGLGLGVTLPRISGGPMTPAGPVTEIVLSLGIGLLGAIALIFSLLFLVVQWAATTFTPRLTLFRDAPIVWRTFALTIGLVVFSVTAALSVGDRTEVSVAVPATELLLLLLLLLLLRTLQLRAFAAIQLAAVVSSVAGRGRDLLGLLTPGPIAPARARSGATAGATTGPGAEEDLSTAPPRSTVVWPGPPAVLQQVDIDRLLRAATVAGAVVVLRFAPGRTLRRGAATADVHGGDLPAGAVLDCLVTGTERTFEQDPTLSLRLLADIALRSLSSAINDPATAVQALDQLEDLLTGPAATAAAVVRVHDDSRTVRVIIRLPAWEEILRSTVDDLVVASFTSPLVLSRMRELLRHLLALACAEHRASIARRLAWLDEEDAARYPRLRAEDPEP